MYMFINSARTYQTTFLIILPLTPNPLPPPLIIFLHLCSTPRTAETKLNGIAFSSSLSAVTQISCVF